MSPFPELITTQGSAVTGMPAGAGVRAPRVEQAVPDERRRFARELHDVAGSRLQAALLHLEVARAALPPDEGAALESLRAAEQQIRACRADARRCAAALWPAELDGRDLAGALADFVGRLRGPGHAGVSLAVVGTPRPLAAEAGQALLRTAQEAVTNALRHAGAGIIRVELCRGPAGTCLSVVDDGRGFDPHRAPPGNGLRGVFDRAGRVGAEAAVLSAPGGGTRVTMTVPHDAGGRHSDGHVADSGVFPFFDDARPTTVAGAGEGPAGEGGGRRGADAGSFVESYIG